MRAAGTALSPVLIAAALAALPPFTACFSKAPVASGQYWFQALSVVVEPWRGPHHVYGLFSIPEQYKFDHLYTARLMIQGSPTGFLAGSPEDEDIESERPEEGYYLKRVYLPTRTALRFLVTARFGDLRTSCQWWLVLTDRPRTF